MGRPTSLRCDISTESVSLSRASSTWRQEPRALVPLSMMLCGEERVPRRKASAIRRIDLPPLRSSEALPRMSAQTVETSLGVHGAAGPSLEEQRFICHEV
ncbi:hypothetical protein NDU88_001579 [Pleurodeles waltl]|uniref:Uncharacterized protein n=1 Tax=Pleurodeles waltl TaxID=8319 RepID=A0AAV7M1I9_PLEWA|nr:hypothetical protein NDU88_001579 [Pleurodeles waltl]